MGEVHSYLAHIVSTDNHIHVEMVQQLGVR